LFEQDESEDEEFAPRPRDHDAEEFDEEGDDSDEGL